MLINKQFHKNDMNVVFISAWNLAQQMGTIVVYSSQPPFSHNPGHSKIIQQYLDFFQSRWFYRAYAYITSEILQQPQHLK